MRDPNKRKSQLEAVNRRFGSAGAAYEPGYKSPGAFNGNGAPETGSLGAH